MSDRLQEIRARVDDSAPITLSGPPALVAAFEQKDADIAWLLDEIQMLHTDIDEVIRKGEDAADYWKQQFDSLRRQHKEMRPCP